MSCVIQSLCRDASEDRKTLSVYQDRSRNSNAGCIPFGRTCRSSRSRSISTGNRGGSWNRMGPRRSPRPVARSLRIPQPLQVGDESARLHRDDEPGRRLVPPAFERGALGEAVERVVHLDRAEPLGVVREPVPLRHAIRIEHAPPVVVLPTAGADVRPHLTSPPRSPSEGVRNTRS